MSVRGPKIICLQPIKTRAEWDSSTYLLTITIMIVLYAEKLLDLDLFWAFLTICLITNFSSNRIYK